MGESEQIYLKVNQEHPLFEAMGLIRETLIEEGMTEKEAEVSVAFLFVCEGRKKGRAWNYWRKVAPPFYGLTYPEMLLILEKFKQVEEDISSKDEDLSTHGQN